MPQDRTLSILMTFRGYYTGTNSSGFDEYGGHVSYGLISSSPGNPTPLELVAPDGKIDVSQWANPDPSTWNNTIDITFSLDANCTLKDGVTVVPAIWSPNMNNSTDPNAYPAMLLLETDKVTPASTSEVEASWVPNSNNTQIVVDDKDESKDYYFRPAVVIPALNNYYISCDPPLVNRQRGGK
jgi:hypothetical protein